VAVTDTGVMSNLRYVRTARLELRAITAGDIDELYGLNSDPRVWTHLPSHVHTSRQQTAAQVTRAVAAWERDGLGYWTARLAADGDFAGIGGCTISHEVAWNVYYRLTPSVQGRGLATEVAMAACEAALTVRPDLPVTALLLEHNLASKAVAEKAGLHLVWRGPDAGNPSPDAVRLVYADRELTTDVLGKVLGSVLGSLATARLCSW
jgi:RimJ/RimL family protein N-acetyltransferase